MLLAHSRTMIDSGGHTNTAGLAVLVVDDEPVLRSMIARALDAEGFTVVLAADGMEAWGLIEEGNGPFDLLVVDMIMPRWDGTTLIRRVRAERPDQKVLLITGRADQGLHAALPQDIPIMLKPFTPDDLVRTVRSIVLPSTEVSVGM
jgi:two-component system, cell cycle sensor histidine kinase and response regulator CckA